MNQDLVNKQTPRSTSVYPFLPVDESTQVPMLVIIRGLYGVLGVRAVPAYAGTGYRPVE